MLEISSPNKKCHNYCFFTPAVSAFESFYYYIFVNFYCENDYNANAFWLHVSIDMELFCLMDVVITVTANFEERKDL